MTNLEIKCKLQLSPECAKIKKIEEKDKWYGFSCLKCREFKKNIPKKYDRKKYDRKKYYENNKENILKSVSIKYIENKEKILSKQKEYYERNKEKIKKRNKEYYEKYKEVINKRQREKRKLVHQEENDL